MTQNRDALTNEQQRQTTSLFSPHKKDNHEN
ncbi:hypothetical protein HNQ48_001517 [Melissococcus plutonius]|nr:hypothetical protein [Melissococcus plutonius]